MQNFIRRWVPTLIGVAVFGAAIVFLRKQLGEYALEDVLATLSAIEPWQISVALVLTLLNYLLLTGYDWLAMRYVRAKLTWRQIAPTSFVAFAIGHNIGFAALSGGAIRYRAYSAAGLSLEQIAKVIGFCTIGFLLGCSLLLGFVLLANPEAAMRASSLPRLAVYSAALGLLCIGPAYLLWSCRPNAVLRLPKLALEPPPTRIAAAQLVVACLDLAIASAILWILLPEAATPAYPLFVGFYLMAIVVTLMSNVPGGLGVFEGTMVYFLTPLDVPAVVGALLAFRALYYLLPFAFALLTLGLQIVLVRRSRTVS